MTRMAPIYTTHNCRFSHPLSWTLSLFWRDPMENADWFSPLNAALAPDGIRLNKDAKLQAVRDMIIKASRAKGYLLGEAGVLPDHVHLLLGCGFEDAPADVALGFLNNLAFAQGMEAVFQFGGFIGTVGEYDFGALRNQTSPDPGKQDRGGTP